MSYLSVLEAQISGVDLEVALNGVTVYRDPTGATKTAQVKLNPWIVEGENVLKARLLPVRQPAAAPSCRLRVIEGPHGEEPGPDGVTVEMVWDPAADPLSAVPVRFDAAWEPDETFGRWVWQDAPTGFPSNSEQAAILEVVRGLHRQLEDRDADGAISMHALKNDEMAQALSVDRRVLEDGQREFLEDAMSASDWSLVPLEEDTLTLEPQAEGRLIEIRGPGSLPPIAATSNGMTVAVGLTVSQVEGDWRIVR